MKKQSRKPRPTPKGKPVNVYTSQCCNVVATKPPCQFLGMKSKEAGTQGLGTFRCTGCHKPCKCNRSKIALDKAPEAVVELNLT
jgi:hypothetical protein